jgi:3D (Asp-Asp-Asp) domain-containing protein
MDPDAVRTAIALTSAVRGCTCQPNVVHRGLVVRIEHDDWCPASDTGQALVIAPKRARTPKET